MMMYMYKYIGLSILNLETQSAYAAPARSGDFYFYESNKKYLSIRTEDGVNWNQNVGKVTSFS